MLRADSIKRLLASEIQIPDASAGIVSFQANAASLCI